MKAGHCLFLLLVLLAPCIYAADSTVVYPINAVPKKMETVNVLHLVKDIGRKNTYQYTCPPGARLIKSNFFEAVNNQPAWSDWPVVGYYFFTCAENYYPNDNYYQKLKNAASWVECQPSAPGSWCTIKANNPPYIRFILKIPPTDRQKSSGTVIVFSNATLYINNALINSTYKADNIAPLVYTWMYDANFPPALPPANYLLNLQWRIEGDASSDRDDQTNPSRRYRCGHDYGYAGWNFWLPITPETFGRTYSLSCLGYWNWKRLPSGVDGWESNSEELIPLD